MTPDPRRERQNMEARILLITGLHPNEACAPAIGDAVAHRLEELGTLVERLQVPREFTLLANLDGEDGASLRHCVRPYTSRLDRDLESLVGDEVLAETYPEHVAFEFHNYSDAGRNDKLAIEDGTPPDRWRIGDIAPGKTGPYEIGYWQNRPPGGVRGKYCLELPAVFVPIAYGRLAKRFQTLQALSARGIDLDEGSKFWMLKELTVEADAARSKEKGYISPQVGDRIAAWILAQMKAGGANEVPRR